MRDYCPVEIKNALSMIGTQTLNHTVVGHEDCVSLADNSYVHTVRWAALGIARVVIGTVPFYFFVVIQLCAQLLLHPKPWEPSPKTFVLDLHR